MQGCYLPDTSDFPCPWGLWVFRLYRGGVLLQYRHEWKAWVIRQHTHNAFQLFSRKAALFMFPLVMCGFSHMDNTQPLKTIVGKYI